MLFSPAALLLLLDAGSALQSPSDSHQRGGIRLDQRGARLPRVAETSPSSPLLQRRALKPPPPAPPPSTETPRRALPQTDPNWKPQEILWRGEVTRTPEQVKAAGGFDSHAKRIFEGKHDKYPNKDAMTPEMFSKGSSLYKYGMNKRDFSQYVSFSTKIELAKGFAEKFKEVGYIYKVRASQGMVDVRETLGFMEGEKPKYSWHYKNADEFEVAAIYHKPFDHVEGWHEYKTDQLGVHRMGPFVPNPDFKPENVKGTYTVSRELAGWSEGNPAWENPLWKPFKDVPPEAMLNEHILRNTDQKTFEEMRPEGFRTLPCTGDGKKSKRDLKQACFLINSPDWDKGKGPEPDPEDDKKPKPDDDKKSNPDDDKKSNPDDDSKKKSGVDDPKNPDAGDKKGSNPDGGRPGPDGSKPPSGDGGKSSPGTKGGGNKVPDPGVGTDLDKVSRRRAARVFPGLMRKNGLTKALERGVTFAKLEQAFLTLKAKTPKLSYRPGGVLRLVALGAWAGRAITLLATDTSGWDRAAALTSVVPFLGCAVDLEADKDRGRNSIVSAIDYGLCQASDALTAFPGGAIFSILVEAVRLVISLASLLFSANYDHQPAPIEKVHEQYVQGWEAFSGNMTAGLQTDAFKRNLTERIEAEKTDVIFMSSQIIGILDSGISSSVSANDSSSQGDVDDSTNSDPGGSQEGTENNEGEGSDSLSNRDPFKLDPKISEVISDRIKRLKQDFKKNMTAQLEDTYAKYDAEFNKQLLRWLSVYHAKGVRDQGLAFGIPMTPNLASVRRRAEWYMNDLKNKFKRDSGPGLEPGPDISGMEQVIDDAFAAAEQGADTKDVSRRPGGETGSPGPGDDKDDASATKISLCENDSLQGPCVDVEAGSWQCIDVPEKMQGKVSSLKPPSKAGSCRIYTETGCKGRRTAEIGKETADLFKDDKLSRFNDRLGSIRCLSEEFGPGWNQD